MHHEGSSLLDARQLHLVESCIAGIQGSRREDRGAERQIDSKTQRIDGESRCILCFLKKQLFESISGGGSSSDGAGHL